jgi:hypothetical protein
MDSVNELIKVKQKPAKILIPWNLYLKLYSRPASVVGSILDRLPTVTADASLLPQKECPAKA